MTIFELVKGSVTPAQAAETYGLKVTRDNRQPGSGRCCCPFHNDHHPSMKLNTDYFYCFTCHESGDVTRLTAQLLGLSQYDAAKKLANDFQLNTNSNAAEQRTPPPRSKHLTISEASFFNAKGKLDEVHTLLDDYIPSMETMNTLMKRYKVAFTDTKQENAALHEENEDLARQLEAASKVSVREQLQQAQIVREYEKARQLLERIPPEVIKTYTASAHKSAPMKESITTKEVY